MNEQQKFLEELEVKEDSGLDAPLEETPAEESSDEPSEETLEPKLKNRRERRLMAKLQSEREANIELNTRLQTISESQKVRDSEEADFLKKIERIYGTATPEGKEASELLKEAFLGLEKTARERALEEMKKTLREEKEQEKRAQAEAEESLEEILENVEENHHVDFSDTTLRKGFLTLLEKLSPKDSEGNIIEYADADSVWEVYEATRQKSQSRAKELASRSLTRSGSSQPSKLEDDSTFRLLREHGII